MINGFIFVFYDSVFTKLSLRTFRNLIGAHLGNEKWRVKNEKWKKESEEWRMKNEKRKMKSEEWRMKSEEWKMKNLRGFC